MRLNAPRGAVGILAAGAVTLLAACGGGGSTSSTSTGGSHLSLSQITVGGPYNADFNAAYIASKEGFFKQQGLQVKIVDAGDVSATATMAAFTGDHYNFLLAAAPTLIAAAQQGEVTTAVYGVRLGAPISIAIDSNIAKAKEIPAADATSNDVLKQLAALKGSHLTVAVSSLSSPAAGDLQATLQSHGLAVGPKGDVSLVPVGTAAAQDAAVSAGKDDALVSDPPTSIVPNTIRINLGLVGPLASAESLYAVALPSFIKAHPDTVQAVVTALTEAWSWAHKNPMKAEGVIATMYNTEGITNSAELRTLFTSNEQFSSTPMMPESSLAATDAIMNVAKPGSAHLPYKTFVNSSFVLKALKNLHLPPKM